MGIFRLNEQFMSNLRGALILGQCMCSTFNMFYWNVPARTTCRLVQPLTVRGWYVHVPVLNVYGTCTYLKTRWCGRLGQVPQPRLASSHWLGHLPSLASPARCAPSKIFIESYTVYPRTQDETTDQEINCRLLLYQFYATREYAVDL